MFRTSFQIQFFTGGSGRNRTYGVSLVTDLQSAAFAAQHTLPFGTLGRTRTGMMLLERF
jgi:hypothetical protein